MLRLCRRPCMHALDKLGFLYFARDKTKKNIKDLHACKYYVYNSIFDCKAFLDTIAGLINHHYKLVERWRYVDLKHKEFKKAIANKDPLLEKEIDKFTVWIESISEWRNTLIHRHGLFLPFVEENRCLIPIKPKRFFEVMLFKIQTVDSIAF